MSANELSRARGAGFQYGLELELHHVCVVALETPPHGRRPALRRLPRATPLFDSPFLNAVSDSISGSSRVMRFRSDLVNAGIDLNHQFEASEEVSVNALMGPVNTLELNTVPFSSPGARGAPSPEEQVARRQISAIDELIRSCMRSPGASPSAWVRVADFVDRFNAAHPDMPLRVHPQLPRDVHFLCGPNAEHVLLDPNRKFGPGYYPQINLSTSLEAFAHAPIEDFLETHRNRKEHAAPKVREEAARVHQAQRGILGASRACAEEAVSYVSLCSARGKSEPKLKKLAGYFAVLSMMVRTETSSELKVNGSGKNRYMYYLKNRVSDVRDQCLSRRDRATLSALNSEQKAELVRILAGDAPSEGARRDAVMFEIPSREVTVGQFLESALFGSDQVCDAIGKVDYRMTGALPPPMESEVPRSKGPLRKLIWEKRDLASKHALSEALGLLDETRQTGGEHSRAGRAP